ncbi:MULTISPECIES: hypothetical protein [Halococcus]|uniref:Uncharacterized protein n=1 Tax=Halococcus salifodinae DSM 8989 TaxID=1227456 RepID=M0MYU8_9EURY|nr:MULTISPECIES: hypothetical protein [Halococcus]EMA50019.1 hypothetical protein C450_15755 [Halococcus salifodinae DSM 8989]
MQRRAAAVYIVFFVVVAIGAYSLITVAEEPTVSVEGQSYAQGDTLQAGGQAWMVNVSDGSGEVSRVNESVQFSTSFANNSTLLYQNETYRTAPNGSGGGGAAGTTTPGAPTTTTPSGAMANGSDGTRFRVAIANVSGGNASSGNASGNASTGNASAGNASGGNASAGNASTANLTSFTLRETFDVNQQLRDDPDVADTALTGVNGTQYVRYQNGTTQPLGEYLPTPETRNVSVGDEFPYANNSTTVSGVNTSGVSLAWTGPQTESMELAAGENVTVGNTTYVTQFGADNSTVTLSQDVAGYQEELADVQDFEDRILGLWGIIIISIFAAILIAALAYMPVRG